MSQNKGNDTFRNLKVSSIWQAKTDHVWQPIKNDRACKEQENKTRKEGELN